MTFPCSPSRPFLGHLALSTLLGLGFGLLLGPSPSAFAPCQALYRDFLAQRDSLSPVRLTGSVPAGLMGKAIHRAKPVPHLQVHQRSTTDFFGYKI